MRRPLIMTGAFGRDAKRFLKKHPQFADALQALLHRVEADAFEPALRTHKLHGTLAGCWACSGGYDLRIVFPLVPESASESVLLLSLGTHDEVY